MPSSIGCNFEPIPTVPTAATQDVIRCSRYWSHASSTSSAMPSRESRAWCRRRTCCRGGCRRAPGCGVPARATTELALPLHLWSMSNGASSTNTDRGSRPSSCESLKRARPLVPECTSTTWTAVIRPPRTPSSHSAVRSVTSTGMVVTGRTLAQRPAHRRRISGGRWDWHSRPRGCRCRRMPAPVRRPRGCRRRGWTQPAASRRLLRCAAARPG